jgi:hypothetical protein
MHPSLVATPHAYSIANERKKTDGTLCIPLCSLQGCVVLHHGCHWGSRRPGKSSNSIRYSSEIIDDCVTASCFRWPVALSTRHHSRVPYRIHTNAITLTQQLGLVRLGDTLAHSYRCRCQ